MRGGSLMATPLSYIGVSNYQKLMEMNGRNKK